MLGEFIFILQWASIFGTSDVIALTTAVSGYWHIPNPKHPYKNYEIWWNNTVRINTPYHIFYGNVEDMEKIKSIRGTLPTHYTYLPLDELEKKFFQFSNYSSELHSRSHLTNQSHNWSLRLIWFSKVMLLNIAYEDNFFNSQWFSWIDIGINTFRDNAPPTTVWPNRTRLLELPTDRFIYSPVRVRLD